jgi:hypothetical protein
VTVNGHRAQILVADCPQGTLSVALGPALARHTVDFARDAFDTLYRIDCAARPYDLLFCDLSRGDLTGPELWAYLSISRKNEAKRMVFVTSGPLRPETLAFLTSIPNVCVELPLEAEALHMLAVRRASQATAREPDAEFA